MAKVKGKHVRAYSGSLGVRRTSYTRRNMVHATFRMLGGHSALVERTQIKTEPSEAQLAQRWLYAQVDRMLDNMSLGQAILWKRFYWYCRARGWTVKFSHTELGTDEIKDTKKNMGYRAFFFKRALCWNLNDWLYLWLKAKWRLSDYSETAEDAVFRVQIVHRDLVKLPTEPRDYKVERIRF